MVSIEQVDGSTARFPAESCWVELFVAQTQASTGETPTGPVADAVRGAAPRERARLESLAASGQAGDFMRRAVACGGLLAVEDDVPDLSEQA
jgi:hypothetical protein